MSNELFIGRKKELQDLKELLHKKVSSLVVIKGRRRIGKSRLIEEFIKGKKFLRFEGLPPTKKQLRECKKKNLQDKFNTNLEFPDFNPSKTGQIYSPL